MTPDGSRRTLDEPRKTSALLSLSCAVDELLAAVAGSRVPPFVRCLGRCAKIIVQRYETWHLREEVHLMRSGRVFMPADRSIPLGLAEVPARRSSCSWPKADTQVRAEFELPFIRSSPRREPLMNNLLRSHLASKNSIQARDQRQVLFVLPASGVGYMVGRDLPRSDQTDSYSAASSNAARRSHNAASGASIGRVERCHSVAQTAPSRSMYCLTVVTSRPPSSLAN